MKRLFLTLVLLCVMISPAWASNTQVYVNKVKLQAAPVIYKNVILVPLRAIFDALGCTIDWNNRTRTVTADKGSSRIILKVNSKLAYKDGRLYALDIPASQVKGRVLVPLRFVSQAFKADIQWSGKTKTAFINISGNYVNTTTSASKLSGSMPVIATPGSALGLSGKDSDIYISLLQTLSSKKGKVILYLDSKLYPMDKIQGLVQKASEDFNEESYSISNYHITTSTNYTTKTTVATITFSYVTTAPENQSLVPFKVVSAATLEDFKAEVKKSIMATIPRTTFRLGANIKSNPEYLSNIIEDITEGIPDTYISSYEVNTFGSRVDMVLKYYYKPEEVLAMKEESLKKAKSVVATLIKPEMTDLEKEKVLHDYVVLHTRYDDDIYSSGSLPKMSYTSYGVFIKGKAVCEGYANALYMLLNLAGVETKVVKGIGTNSSGTFKHAWNLVKISGIWYHLDATWDDPVPDKPGEVSYNYFNLSNEEIRKDHSY